MAQRPRKLCSFTILAGCFSGENAQFKMLSWCNLALIGEPNFTGSSPAEAAGFPGRRLFSTSPQASAVQRQSTSQQKAQQQRSQSGHKQRKSPYSPQIPPDDSPTRFRPPDSHASLAQLQSSQVDAGRGGLQQREVVLNPRGKRVYQQPQNKPAAPWTPTRLLGKRKVYTKRMGFLMQVLLFRSSSIGTAFCKERSLPILCLYSLSLLEIVSLKNARMAGLHDEASTKIKMKATDLGSHDLHRDNRSIRMCNLSSYF